jgi:neutral ceramidase
MVTLPGEPLLQLGWEVRNDSMDLGFNNTLLAGYSNNHMGYFATPNEYEVGGYESLLTMWGEFTAERMRESCKKVAEQVKPS